MIITGWLKTYVGDRFSLSCLVQVKYPALKMPYAGQIEVFAIDARFVNPPQQLCLES
jgi:hypothetical protein